MSDADTRCVDARGLHCPEPAVLARRALDASAPGAMLELWCTDPLAPVDLEALCLRLGHDYLGSSLRDDGVQVCRMRRRDRG